jgi:hypothetical protein
MAGMGGKQTFPPAVLGWAFQLTPVRLPQKGPLAHAHESVAAPPVTAYAMVHNK